MKKSNLEFSEVIHNYVLENSLRESQVLSDLREETAKDPSAIMQIPPEQGQFMSMLVKLVAAKRSIEIGVFTGYSTLCVAQAMPEDSYTLACDIDEKWTAIAKRYWIKAGVDKKIDLRIAPAIDTLKSQIEDGQAGSYDFVFIDADKDNYDHYYELSLQLLKSGGLMAIDNVLLFGAVAGTNYIDKSMQGVFSEQSIEVVKKLNIKIQNDQRVDVSMLKIADGLSLVRKK